MSTLSLLIAHAQGPLLLGLLIARAQGPLLSRNKVSFIIYGKFEKER